MSEPNMSEQTKRIKEELPQVTWEPNVEILTLSERLDALIAKVEKLENAPEKCKTVEPMFDGVCKACSGYGCASCGGEGFTKAPAADLLTEEERAVVEHIRGDFRGKVPYVRTLFRVIDRIAPKPCTRRGTCGDLTHNEMDDHEDAPAVGEAEGLTAEEIVVDGIVYGIDLIRELRDDFHKSAQQLAAERERVKELEDLLRWICVDALNEAWMYEVRSRAKDDYISLRHIKERIIKALSPKENANAK